MDRFLKGPWGAKESIDVSPGAAKGRKKRHEGRAGARQALGKTSSLAKWLLGLASRARLYQ